MKSRILLVVLFMQLFISSCRSQNHREFDLFLDSFIEIDYPIIPTQIFLDIEIRLERKHISEYDYNKYLRSEKDNDTTWRFHDYYDYTYGGKFVVQPNVICVIYRRDYMPDDINKQKGEVVLTTFSKMGDMISYMPVSGGYGDSITFTSIIHNPQMIEVKYKTYNNDDVSETMKTYRIEKTGRITPH
jgi:hypothetical protein